MIDPPPGAVVTMVHAGLFVYASGARLADVARFVPLNLVGAALVLAAQQPAVS